MDQKSTTSGKSRFGIMRLGATTETVKIQLWRTEEETSIHEVVLEIPRHMGKFAVGAMLAGMAENFFKHLGNNWQADYKNTEATAKSVLEEFNQVLAAVERIKVEKAREGATSGTSAANSGNGGSSGNVRKLTTEENPKEMQ